MKNQILFPLLLIYVFACVCQVASAQDVIYTVEKNIIKCKIIGVENNDLIYIENVSSKVTHIELAKAFLIFNEKGNFLLVEDYTQNKEGQGRIREDFFAEQALPRYDMIIGYDNTVIRCEITYESNDVVNYKKKQSGSPGTKNKSDIMFIIYKDGKHKILTQDFIGKSAEFRLAKADIKEKLLEEEKELANAPEPINNTATVPQQLEPEPVKPSESQKNVESAKDVSGVLQKPVLSDEQYKEYSNTGKQKVMDFESFLQIITDKQKDQVEKDKAIEQALRLFTPNATIEISQKLPSGEIQKNTRKVSDYLKRLKFSSYSSITMEWSDIHYVNELTQEADGNYYGVIRGTQRFQGYDTSGNIKYSDETVKDVKVMVKSYKKIIEALEKQQWDVLLGNIGIVETK
ncbi:hypothetical protein [Emticicia soli]|uniref:Uncharacterized protein n=1 Tax=Emticicia soli TaxID=2027878 RepID=A0ABW5J2I9_9BACT